MLHDLADGAVHRGDFGQGRPDAFVHEFRLGGTAQDAQSGGDVEVDGGAGADDGAVADVHVIGDAGLSREDRVFSRARRARDAGLAHQQIVWADRNVVGDLHQVVDLGAGADGGGLEGASV